MSQANYNYAITKSARMALALKREWTRHHFQMSVQDIAPAPAATTHDADKMSAVEQTPTFGMWTVAWVNGTPYEQPAYQAIRVIKVPGIRTRRLVEHTFAN